MASLRSGKKDQSIEMGLTIDVLGVEESSGPPKWLSIDLSIQAFGVRINRPGNASISRSDLGRLIEWLRRAARSDSPVPTFETEDEPLLRAEIQPSDGSELTISVFLTAHGASKTYLDESVGASVTFDTTTNRLLQLADELENESETARLRKG